MLSSWRTLNKFTMCILTKKTSRSKIKSIFSEHLKEGSNTYRIMRLHLLVLSTDTKGNQPFQNQINFKVKIAVVSMGATHSRFEK